MLSPNQSQTPREKNVLLLVDDCFYTRETIKMVLVNQMGFKGEILEAENKKGALDLLRKMPAINAILSDINMPTEKEGLELAKAVRKKLRPEIAMVLHSASKAQETEKALSNSIPPIDDIPVFEKDLPAYRHLSKVLAHLFPGDFFSALEEDAA
jgi:response regulator RpfG family c-di-GMP phosphodiesterase